MHRAFLFTCLLLLLLPAVLRADDKPKAEPSDVTLKTQQDRVSYGIGQSQIVGNKNVQEASTLGWMIFLSSAH